MKFEPKTEQEVSNLLPAGIYDAEINTAEDTTSKSGNEMIKVDLAVFDEKAGKYFIFDYLMEAMAFKLRHAAESCGLLAKYNKGELSADDFIGKTCKVKVKIDDKVASNKKNNTDYLPSNVVADYVVTDKPVKKTTKKETEEELSDSVPF